APAPATALLAIGKKFIDGSKVHLDDQPLVTRWKDPEHLEADVPLEVLKTAGVYRVKVVTPAPAGGASQSLSFTVQNPVPVLNNVAPLEVPSKKGDQIINLTGSNFVLASQVFFGAQALATTFVSATELRATIPGALLTTSGVVPITVFNPAPGGGTSGFINLTVRSAGPVITGFAPTQGPVGSEVTITGENFDALSPGSNQVRFNGALAVVSQATPTQLKVIVPLAATTGPVSVTNATGTATSTSPFTVLVTEDFTIAVAPGNVKLPLGGNAAALVQLTSTGLRPYQQLIDLTVTGLPAGLEAAFNQARLSRLQPVLLTLKTTAAVAAGSYPVTVTARGLSDGRQVTRNQTFTLEVLAAGTTTLSGRVVHASDDRPFVGAIVRLGTETAVTNEAGQYRFINPILRGDQVILIDGHTNNTPAIEFPSSIVLPVHIAEGQDNVALTSFLQGIDTTSFTQITPGAAATVTTPEIPNFALKIPQGATLIGWDGQPIDKINVRTVTVDRLPIRPLPAGVNTRTVYLYYFFRPGGAFPSEPIPVTMNNDTGALPGEKVELWYYDESPEADPSSNQWRIMGQGTVSEDGKSIVSDPGVGIPKFCCGATFANPPPPPP
ncbi:MAG TPA: IPT/TIG domain-containing protein, partial [bacterium]|nr:IPT/TIG domain-containing protein [bacterium]